MKRLIKPNFSIFPPLPTIVFFFILLFQIPAALPFENLAIQGRMDLSEWDPSKDKKIDLDGEWEFYWQRLLSPSDFRMDNNISVPGYLRVPGLWNQYHENQNFWSGDGFATYRLRIEKIPSVEIPLAFYIKEIPTAYRLWSNGRLISENGVVGTSLEEMIPWYQPQLVPYDAAGNSIELVLQVSNFFHKDGGVWYSVEFGTRDGLSSTINKRMYIDLILFGVLLIMGCYHIGLFALRCQDKTTLFFGLFCLFIGFRSILVGQRLFATMFPEVSWSVQQKMEFIFLYLSVPSFCLFFYHLFPKEVSRKLSSVVLVICLFFSLTVLFFEVKIYAHTANALQIMIYIIAAYMVYCLYSIIQLKREGGLLFTAGFIVILIASINDTLKTHFLIQTTNLIHVGVFLFVFFQSFLISKKFSAAFHKVEEITGKLKVNNRELIRMNKLKDEFLANTSHELKTPLHGVIGIAESMIGGATGKLTTSQTQNLSMIVASGKRLFNLIQDLLDFSRMRRNDMKLEIQPLDLKSITDLVVAFFQPMANEKKLSVRNNVTENLPPVLADENRLQQILFNLVGNAIKFTPSGEVIISATCSGNKVKIAISDTGIGISQKDVSRIFKEFEQVDGSINRMYHGTGLGLAISQKLAALHGSAIAVASTLNKGSVFSFELPISASPVLEKTEPSISSNRILRMEDQPVEMVSMEPAIETARSNPTSGKILVVDDEPVNLQLIYNQLSLHGYHVITAQDGYEALDLIPEEKPDLVLLDIMMPRINGFEVCQKIRTAYDFYTLPIIILSAKNRLSDLVQGFNKGANDYLTKPFYKEELLARISTHLHAKDSVERLKQNTRLKAEVQRRQKVEEELRSSQRKLLRILDASKDPIVAANAIGLIQFFNQEAEHVFGYSLNEVMNQNIEMLFPEHSSDILQNIPLSEPNGLKRSSQKKLFNIIGRQSDGIAFLLHLQLSSCFIGEERFLIFIVTPLSADAAKNFTNVKAAVIENMDEAQSGKMIALENAFHHLASYLGKNKPEEITELRSIDPRLDRYEDRLSGDGHEEKLRCMLVKTMVTALRFWEMSTGKTKVDLAEESNIWKAYLDGGTWKTRTLDKYLNGKTLPGKPRWREVLRTANFVLAHCPLSDSQAKEFKRLVQETEELLHQRTL